VEKIMTDLFALHSEGRINNQNLLLILRSVRPENHERFIDICQNTESIANWKKELANLIESSHCAICGTEHRWKAGAELCEIRHVCQHDSAHYYLELEPDEEGTIDLCKWCHDCQMEVGSVTLDQDKLAQVYTLLKGETNAMDRNSDSD
jgi:hypothetical protein